jgi:hypothetical protein
MKAAGVEEMYPEQIYNMDETHLSWGVGVRRVIARRGKKYARSVLANSKSGCTVAFTVRADGKLLPPFLIYKVCTVPNHIMVEFV